MVNDKDFHDEGFQKKIWDQIYEEQIEYVSGETVIGFETWYTSIGSDYLPHTMMSVGRYINYSVSWTIPKGLKKIDVELELVSFKQPDVLTPKAGAAFFLTAGRGVYIDNLEEDMETLLKSKKVLITALDLEEYPVSDLRFVMDRGRSKGASYTYLNSTLIDNILRDRYKSEMNVKGWTSVDAERLDDYTIRVYISAGVTPNTPDFNDLVFNLKFEAPLSECKVGFRYGDYLYLI